MKICKGMYGLKQAEIITNLDYALDFTIEVNGGANNIFTALI